MLGTKLVEEENMKKEWDLVELRQVYTSDKF